MIKDKIKNLFEKFFWYVMKRYHSYPPSLVNIIYKRAAEESADFVERHLDNVMLFHDKRQLWDFCLKESSKEGLFIECGVFNADSINYFAKNNQEINFFGFDSFEGLSENWKGSHKGKGAFDLDGVLPKVESNVELIKGWIDDTYLFFLKEHSQKISFLNIDTDTYSPALTILKESKPYLKIGTIIVFDELIGYPNWKNGEFKALNEVLLENEYEFIAFANSQSAIRILNVF
jgi:hypothetical protein